MGLIPAKETTLFLFFMKNHKEVLKPYTEKERYPCPFYGFNGMFDVMIDSKGNQCALITDSHSPCQMEMQKQRPDWSKCSANTTEITPKLEEVMEKMQVFPDEFRPGDVEHWKGISLKDWMDYVLR